MNSTQPKPILEFPELPELLKVIEGMNPEQRQACKTMAVFFQNYGRHMAAFLPTTREKEEAVREEWQGYFDQMVNGLLK